MTLLESLLDTIVRLDGEALIMHVGEKPYVVLSSSSISTFRGPLSWGQVELSSRPLSTDAVMTMLGQMLSPEQRRMLDDLGAIEHEIQSPGESGERFVVTAARGGEDVWIEVKRKLKAADTAALAEFAQETSAGPVIVETAADGPHAEQRSVPATEYADGTATRGAPAARHDAAEDAPERGQLAPSTTDVEAVIAARAAALEADAQAALAAKTAALAEAAEAALAARVTALTSEAEITLAATQAALAEASEAALAAKSEALEAAAAAALASREAALAAAAEATLAERAAAIEADARAAAAASLAERSSAIASEAESALAAREAALAAAARTSLAEHAAALAAESEAVLAARQAQLEAAAEATLAAKATALAAEVDTVLAAREASLAAAAEAALAERIERLTAAASAALAHREAELEAAALELSARAASVGTQVETTLSAREAALAQEAEAAIAAATAALTAEADALLAQREMALAASAETSLASRLAALAADADAARTATQAALAAEAEAALASHAASLAESARAALAERLASLEAESRASRLTLEEQARAAHASLEEETRAAHAARQAALAEAEAALAARAAALAERTESILAERLAALEADARAAHAARDAALAAEAEAALALKAAALADRTESILAERLVALEAEARAAHAAREAAFAADAQSSLAAQAAALAADAQAALAAQAAALAAGAQATLDARLAEMQAEARAALTQREAALAADADAVLAARREQERLAEAIAVEHGIAAELDAAVADTHAALASGAGSWPPVELDGLLHAEMRRPADWMREAVDGETDATPTTMEECAGAEEPVVVRQRLAPAPARDGAVSRTDEAAEGAVVLPILGRPTLKLQQPLPQPALPAASTEASLVELLRSAVTHRASAVYAVVDTRPMMRVEGQINVVGTESFIAAGDVERFIFEFAPRNLVADAAPEWTCIVPGVGRVRCVTFHDQSGAGLIFHLPAADVSAADEIGLSGEIQALCRAADGLIVITGPRASGKSSMLNAIVDVINRTRYDHVITIESRIRVRHERRCSFISQREVRGDGDAIAAAARSALREGADVLVIEDLRAPEALSAALDAARAGRLVLGSISAPSAPVALERLVDAFPADRRPHVRASLAGALRAVVAQVLVPKVGGGRTAAREVLLSSPAVRKLLLEGATGQLPIAIEGGRSLGMRPMVDALGALVRDGIVEIAEACGVAPDRAALIAALERDGVDVSAVERRA